MLQLAIDCAGNARGEDGAFGGEDRLDSFNGDRTFVSIHSLRRLNRGQRVSWGNTADIGLAFWNYARVQVLKMGDKVKLAQKETVSAETRLLGHHHVAFAAFREILEKYCHDDSLPR